MPLKNHYWLLPHLNAGLSTQKMVFALLAKKQKTEKLHKTSDAKAFASEKMALATET